MQVTIQVNIDVVEHIEDNNAIARIFYPSEGNKIIITKGLNVVELSDAIHHEIGHLIDWYLSEGYQSEDVNIREENANLIGDCIRFRESTKQIN